MQVFLTQKYLLIVCTLIHSPGSELLQGLKGRSLKQNTVGFLFCLPLFHWCFPIYLSDQVIEDLREGADIKHKIKRNILLFILFFLHC